MARSAVGRFVVRRAGQTLTLTTTVRERTSTRFSLSRATTLTPKQTRIWQGIATGL